jgi:hypothetical protein
VAGGRGEMGVTRDARTECSEISFKSSLGDLLTYLLFECRPIDSTRLSKPAFGLSGDFMTLKFGYIRFQTPATGVLWGALVREEDKGVLDNFLAAQRAQSLEETWMLVKCITRGRGRGLKGLDSSGKVVRSRDFDDAKPRSPRSHRAFVRGRVHHNPDRRFPRYQDLQEVRT